MVDGRAQAESGKRADTTDAEQNFLLDAHIEIAAVELRGDGAVIGTIDRQIGVEKIEGDAANGNAPDTRGNFAAGQIDFNFDVGDELHGEDMEVIFFEGFLLPASGIEVLAKISFLVEQANGDERESQIAGGFEVIAGEYAQASGKDGKAFGDAKFERKIGDEHVGDVAVFALEPGALAGEIGVEAFRDTVEMGEEGIVEGSGFEDGLFDAAEESHRIAAHSFPQIAIETAEKINSGMIPGPAEIVGDWEQGLQSFR